MDSHKVYLPPIQPVSKPAGHPVKPEYQPQVPFADVLAEAQGSLKFSEHAKQRLAIRRITLSKEDVRKIQEAVDKAAGKGARDSLILYKDLALVVSVKNRTVITAMDGASCKENVFTNIDSAVIL